MQISDEIIEVLEYLCMKFGIVIDWTSSNVLPYLEELCEKFIAWEISTSFAWIILASGVTLFLLVFSIIANCIDSCDWDWLWIVFFFALAISILIIGVQIFDIIECKTFPEKAIYDYIQYYLNLLK